MVNLIRLKCDDAEVWIEAEELVVKEKRPQRVSVSETMERTILSFEKITDTLSAYCTSLVRTFKGFKTEHAPDRIKAEFGLKVSGEGNVYVVKSAAEGSLKITAEWEMK